MSDESDSQVLIPRAERIVDVRGEMITIALVRDVPYVALRTFADYLGLDWSAQRQRTERDEVLASEVRPIVMTGADGRQREMLGLPLEYLPGWLFGVSPNRVRPELREKVMTYRRYCFQTLWRAAQIELLRSGALAPSTNPQAVEITEQISALTDVVNLLREHLAGLIVLPGQVSGLSTQLDQAVNLLESLAERQEAADRQLTQIDARTQRLTPAHAREVQTMVERMVRETRKLPQPLTYAMIYGRLKHRFRVGSYSETSDDRFDELMTYLLDELRRATGGGAPEQGNLF
jgi:hypothetical protein